MKHVICFHNPDEGNGYLGNWYPSPFEKDGVSFAHMEQYMMYRKALQFQDMESAQQILQTDNPGKVKALGRSVRNYVDSQWSAVRQQIVYEGLLENSGKTSRFSRNCWQQRPICWQSVRYTTESGASDCP